MKKILFLLLCIVFMPLAVAQSTGYALSLEQEVEAIMSGRFAMQNKVFFLSKTQKRCIKVTNRV